VGDCIDVDVCLIPRKKIQECIDPDDGCDDPYQCDIPASLRFLARFLAYTGLVARGWESKSVEDQINERAAEAQNTRKDQPSAHELEQKAKREGILLARSHTAAILESTRDERYRTLLKRTLEHLDSELAKFT
jgi:hypothetical protein